VVYIFAICENEVRLISDPRDRISPVSLKGNVRLLWHLGKDVEEGDVEFQTAAQVGAASNQRKATTLSWAQSVDKL
jgi:hypothetical protein